MRLSSNTKRIMEEHRGLKLSVEKLEELRKNRKKALRQKIKTVCPIIGRPTVNRKKNPKQRRARPSPEVILARSTYVWPKGISESKYDSKGNLKSKDDKIII